VNDATLGPSSNYVGTMERGIEILRRLIKQERGKMREADKAFESLDKELEARLATLEQIRNDKINPDTRRDDRPSISGPAPAAGEIYRGVNVDRVFNP
jgi:DNA-binding protein H-NS